MSLDTPLYNVVVQVAEATGWKLTLHHRDGWFSVSGKWGRPPSTVAMETIVEWGEDLQSVLAKTLRFLHKWEPTLGALPREREVGIGGPWR